MENVYQVGDTVFFDGEDDIKPCEGTVIELDVNGWALVQDNASPKKTYRSPTCTSASKNREEVEAHINKRVQDKKTDLLEDDYWIKELFESWYPYGKYRRQAMIEIINEKLGIDLSKVKYNDSIHTEDMGR